MRVNAHIKNQNIHGVPVLVFLIKKICSATASRRVENLLRLQRKRFPARLVPNLRKQAIFQRLRRSSLCTQSRAREARAPTHSRQKVPPFAASLKPSPVAVHSNTDDGDDDAGWRRERPAPARLHLLLCSSSAAGASKRRQKHASILLRHIVASTPRRKRPPLEHDDARGFGDGAGGSPHRRLLRADGMAPTGEGGKGERGGHFSLA